MEYKSQFTCLKIFKNLRLPESGGKWITTFFVLLMLSYAITASPGWLRAEGNSLAESVHVKTLMVKPETLELKTSSVGRLYPNREVKILVEIPGMVSQYFQDVGDPVKKDQILVKLDPTGYQLDLDQAMAELKTARVAYQSSLKKFERSKELARKKIISREEFEDLETELKDKQSGLERTQIRVQIAEHKFKKTIIKAPFSGTIGNRLAEIGQIVEFGDELFSLVDLSSMRAKVNILEEDYVYLDKNDPAKVEIDVYPQNTFKGKIDKIGVAADQKTSSFPIEVVIENPNLLLKAGFSVRVSVLLAKLKNVYFIPADALIYDSKGPAVLIVNHKNRVYRQSIRVGKTIENRVPVFDGLNSKKRVIIRGQDNVSVSSKVTISN